MTIAPTLRRLSLLLLLALLLAHGGAAQVQNIAPQSATESGAPRVAYLPIHGPIDRVRHQFLQRALARAAAQNFDTLVVDIDTDGGEVYYAREMLKLILDQPRAGLNTVAFVGYRAISAGALIAYGHQQVYISDTATIGDIGVIFVAPGGEIKFASEKIETVIRALLTQAAEQNGWNRGALLKMTARDQKLYRATLADGTIEYVIEDDLPAFLAAHPKIDKKNTQHLIVHRGKNRLLTLTGREALALNMASGLADDLDAVYQKLGVNAASVVDLSPGGLETVAGYLAGWAPLLAGLAIMFLLFELKTPGVGVWLLLSGGFGALFMIAQYTLDMIDYIDLILLAAGLALLLIEFMTMAGGGLLAVAGIGLAFAGLTLAFVPNEFDYNFNDPQFAAALRDAVLRGLLALLVVIIGAAAFITLVPRSRLANRAAVRAEITATSDGAQAAAAASLIGRRGVSVGPLRPGGVVAVDGRDYTARARYGAAIDAGSAVSVVAVEFGELIVSEDDA